MKRGLRVILYLIILFFFQVYFLDYLKIFGIRADIFIPVLVTLGLNVSLWEILGFSLLVGFLRDIAGSYAVGINCWLYLIAGGFIYWIAHTLVIESMWNKTLVIIAVIILINFLECGFLYLLGATFNANIFFKTLFSLIFFTFLFSSYLIRLTNFVYQ